MRLDGWWSDLFFREKLMKMQRKAVLQEYVEKRCMCAQKNRFKNRFFGGHLAWWSRNVARVLVNRSLRPGALSFMFCGNGVLF